MLQQPRKKTGYFPGGGPRHCFRVSARFQRRYLYVWANEQRQDVDCYGWRRWQRARASAASDQILVSENRGRLCCRRTCTLRGTDRHTPSIRSEGHEKDCFGVSENKNWSESRQLYVHRRWLIPTWLPTVDQRFEFPTRGQQQCQML